MNLIETLQWDCIQWSGKESSRSVLVNHQMKQSIGEEVISNGKSGLYLASSKCGITIFDLFAEILREDDLRQGFICILSQAEIVNWI